ncbi:MAG: membrane protein insertase YidC, partial [Thermoanaerobaculia bacterium]
METKRLVLAFALSAAVLIGWTVLFPPPKPSAPAARPAATAPAAAPSATTAAPATQTSLPAPAAQAARERVVPVSAGAEEL